MAAHTLCRACREDAVADPNTPRPTRLDPPDIAGLRRLRVSQPELAAAIDLQIDIVTLQRRLQVRLSTPWIELDADAAAADLAAGSPLLRVPLIGFDWLELRLLFRQMADLLLRHEVIESADHHALSLLSRGGRPDREEVESWFEAKRTQADTPSPAPSHQEAINQTLELCARPFVERAAEALRARVDLAAWSYAYCPLCGSAPEMGSRLADGSHRLHCASCGTSWPYPADMCPFCRAIDPSRAVSYESPDARYRLQACLLCRRYLKYANLPRLDRPVMLNLDSIATLGLDAAAMQQGFSA